MPRELVHWEVAYRAVRRCAAANPRSIAGIAADNPGYLALGAVAHDAPYYFKAGADPFEAVGTLLHGRGGNDAGADPLALLDRFGALSTQLTHEEARCAALAFLVGLISHYASDVAFHPFVFYATGDYYAPDPNARRQARARHRLIEVYLDEHLRAMGTTFTWPDRVWTLIKECSPDSTAAICRLLGEATAPFIDTTDPLRATALDMTWWRSLKHMAYLQASFLSPFLGAIAAGLNSISQQRLYQYDCLFSRGRTGRYPPFDAPLHLKNPVTGDEDDTTFTALLKRAEDGTVAWVEAIDRTQPAGGYREGTLHGGLSLNYGVLNAGPMAATFFSPAPLPDKRTTR